MIRQVVLKLASHCNLNCSYCYLYNHEDDSWKSRPAFISDDVYDAALAALAAYCSRPPAGPIEILFHGGEPTLVGAKRFAALVARARSVLGPALASIGLQTNATRIDRQWVDVLVDGGVGVSISLDGPPEIHDLARVNRGGGGSYYAALRGLDLLRAANLDPGVLCVVNPAASGRRIYDHFRSLGLRGFTFLPPDVSHDNKATLLRGLPLTAVGDYLIGVFDAWLDEDDPDVRVEPFADLLKSMMGASGGGDLFGNPAQSYIIIETDGAIETLDALRVCENGITRTELNVRTHGLDEIAGLNPLLDRMLRSGLPLCATCRNCGDVGVCGGGYPPHRFSRARGFDNPSVWCADIKALLDHVRRRTGVSTC